MIKFADGIQCLIKELKGIDKKIVKLDLKEEHWKTLSELEIILKPFMTFTEFMSFNRRPTISLLIPLVESLLLELSMTILIIIIIIIFHNNKYYTYLVIK
jgi:type IV secretory pathway VirB6-like protein